MHMEEDGTGIRHEHNYSTFQKKSPPNSNVLRRALSVWLGSVMASVVLLFLLSLDFWTLEAVVILDGLLALAFSVSFIVFFLSLLSTSRPFAARRASLLQLLNAKSEFGSLPMYGENGKQYSSHFKKENSEDLFYFTIAG